MSTYSNEEESEESSCSEEEESGEETDSSEEDEEPLLKYNRFAKAVVNSLNPAQGETKNVIECMAVHPKVRVSVIMGP